MAFTDTLKDILGTAQDAADVVTQYREIITPVSVANNPAINLVAATPPAVAVASNRDQEENFSLFLNPSGVLDAVKKIPVVGWIIIVAAGIGIYLLIRRR